jgi:hypothetical protein
MGFSSGCGYLNGTTFMQLWKKVQYNLNVIYNIKIMEKQKILKAINNVLNLY